MQRPDGEARRRMGPGPRAGAQRPGASGRRALPELTDEQERELLEWLKENRPEHYRRLEEAKTRRPENRRAALAMMWQWYADWKRMPPEVREQAGVVQRSRLQIWRLVRAINRATDRHEAQRLTGELRETVARLVEAEQKVQAYELEQMEKRLAQLRARLEEARKNREKIVEQRVEEAIERAGSSAEPGDGRRPGDRTRRDGPGGQRPRGPRGDSSDAAD
jgi:hypothetical protein